MDSTDKTSFCNWRALQDTFICRVSDYNLLAPPECNFFQTPIYRVIPFQEH